MSTSATRVKFRRPVHLTTQEWHRQLLAHVPPSAWRMSRDTILYIRTLRAPIRRGSRRASDTRLSLVELTQLCKVRDTRITMGAVDFVTRMPHAMVLYWRTEAEAAIAQAQQLA